MMHHCNGPGCARAMTAMAGSHLWLRRVDPAPVLATIAERRVTHLYGRPIVPHRLAQTPAAGRPPIRPPGRNRHWWCDAAPAVIEALKGLVFGTPPDGSTGSDGPPTLCTPQRGWAYLALAGTRAWSARVRARPPSLAMTDVLAGGTTPGEALCSNGLMQDDLRATETVFARARFHTGGTAVDRDQGSREGRRHRRREHLLTRGRICFTGDPQVVNVAVVAKLTPVWGERTGVVLTRRPDRGQVSEEDITARCGANLARCKGPRPIAIGSLPRTFTGKIRQYALRDRANGVAP